MADLGLFGGLLLMSAAFPPALDSIRFQIKFVFPHFVLPIEDSSQAGRYFVSNIVSVRSAKIRFRIQFVFRFVFLHHIG